jgi:hypothetical protein
MSEQPELGMPPKAPSQENGRVLQFRPRVRPPTPDQKWPPVDDLSKYAQNGDVDYRHRMLMNLIAILVAVVLVGCGIWLTNAIVQMRKDQDCILSGRRNCMTINAPVDAR